MPDTTIVTKRVNRGVALLDEWVPNWRERVKIEHLWMPSGTRCILGQLYGEFDIGAEALDITYEEDQYGFCIYLEDKFDQYAELQTEWVRVLSDA